MGNLTLHSVSKNYGKKTALFPSDVSFSSGIYAILGPNGAGKSTMMNMICGLCLPTQGEIRYDGIPIAQLRENYREKVSMLFQHQPLYPNYTAMEYLTFMGHLKGLSRSRSLEEGDTLLIRFGLPDQHNKKIRTFSGGMKQRLALAGTLLGGPEIIILDEPSVGLDPKEREALKRTLAGMRSDHLILISTHIVSDVDRIADHTLLLKNGHILRNQDTSSLIAEFSGKIWEIPEEEQFLLPEKDCYFENGSLRSFGNEKPVPHAIPAVATLQDVYFCLLEGGGDAS